jgi:hypothetical protein
MWRAVRRSALAGAVAVVVMSVLAPTAGASITPTVSLDQSAGTAAGSTAGLGVDLKFAPTGRDSPDDLTLNLPPGLLANASINGGACLQSADLIDSACQVGSGTVTADAYGYIPIPTPVTFDLVPPPHPGDLAGLAVNNTGTQIGSTADVRVRPSGDPFGVGVTITFVLPNNLYGTPISITEIKSTFDGLRYPTTCPATPQSFSIAVNSYSDTSVHTAAAPLSVTACSALPFSPAFKVSAVRDTADKQAKVTTDITQGADEAPSRSVALTLPVSVLPPNVASVKLLCPNLSSGSCTPVGSATATSPLYPKPLTGEAYLTGSFTGLTVTIVFPSPFPLTLTGSVDLTTNTTTFTGLPDIPLTGLVVTLDSGPYGLFEATCGTPSGTATAALTDQNGDKSARVPARFTVSGCGSSAGGSSGGGGGSAGPALSQVRFSGLPAGRPALSFQVSEPRGAARLAALTVELPQGLHFALRRARRPGAVTGVAVSPGAIRSLAIDRGHLVIVLRRGLTATAVSVTGPALSESGALRRRARARRLTSLTLAVVVRSTTAGRATIRARTTNLGL